MREASRFAKPASRTERPDPTVARPATVGGRAFGEQKPRETKLNGPGNRSEQR